MATARVLVVGAGLSGLTAAQRLLRGPDGLGGGDVVIVDKGRTVGGRLATRRIGGATLDHGAQFFTVRSDEFRADVDRWLEAGVVEEWCRGFGEIDGYPRYRVAGGMNRLAHHLASELEAAGVTIATNRRVTGVRHDGNRWVLGHQPDGDDAVPGESGADDPYLADALVVTPPVPQSLELLATGGVELAPESAKALEAMAYHRVIALLTVLDRSPDLASPGALQQPSDPTFTFVADNRAKGISAEPAVTFHTAHARSAELWDASDPDVLDALLPAARDLIAPAEIVEIQVKRWRYTGPVTPHPEPCLVASLTAEETPGPLVFAGDGFGGSKVEGAYLSGVAAAASIKSA